MLGKLLPWVIGAGAVAMMLGAKRDESSAWPPGQAPFDKLPSPYAGNPNITKKMKAGDREYQVSIWAAPPSTDTYNVAQLVSGDGNLVGGSWIGFTVSGTTGERKFVLGYGVDEATMEQLRADFAL